MLLNKKKPYEKNAFSGAVSLTLSVLIVKILGVLYKIPLAAILSEEGMGYFNSAYTVFSFFYILCTAGVPKSIMILVSEKLVKKDETGVFSIIKTALISFLCLGVGLSLLLSLLSKPLSDLIGSPNAKATLVFVAPSIIFVSVTGVFRGYLMAKMRLGSIAVSQIVEGVLKLVFGLFFAILATKAGMSYVWISALTILGASIGAFGGLLYLYIIFRGDFSSLDYSEASRQVSSRVILAKIYKMSAPITLSAALMSLSGIIDLFLIINRLQSIGYTASEATALYGNYTTLAISMFNLAISIITPISVSFMPSLARSRAEENDFNFCFGLRSALEFTALVSAPIVIGFMVYAKEILAFLFTESMAESGGALLAVVSPAILFMSIILVLNSALEAMGRPGLAMISMLIGAVIKVVVSGLLIGKPDFGISGAPIGTVVSYAISALISLIMVSNITNHSTPVLSTSFLPYLVGSIAVLASKNISDSIFFTLNFRLNLILSITLAALIYIALLLFCRIISGAKIKKTAKLTKFT